MMITSYLTLAIRSLQRSKSLSFINILGLSMGLAVSLVILNYVSFELSYDRHHTNGDTIYRTILTRYLNGEFRDVTPLTGYGTGPALLSDVPAVKHVARAHALFGGALLSFANADKAFQFHEERAYMVDPSFLDIFTFTALAGELETALDRPNSMVVTRSLANKYFGGLQAMDKTIKVTGGWMDEDFTITAIIEDQPQNSSLVFDFLLPIEGLLKDQQYVEDNGWGWKNFVTYVQVYPGTDMKALKERMPSFLSRYVTDKQEISFQPFFDIHTRPGFAFDSPDRISRDKIYFYALIAAFILFIAWINYINLSTARTIERAREVGVKKAIGAQRKQLIFQFLLEAAIINFMAIALALVVATASLPAMSDIVGKELTFNFRDVRLWIFITGLAICGTICAGLYPAFVLSSFRVTTVLKGGVERVSTVFPVRKALVVFQFTCSILLISMTLVVHRQIIFMEQVVHNLKMEEILVLRAPYVMDVEGQDERLKTFKNQLIQHTFVKSACTSAGIPGGGYTFTTTMRKLGDLSGNHTSGNVIWVDRDFIDTYNIEMLSGKVWEEAQSSQERSLIINETAMSAFGIKNPDEALTHNIVFENDTFAIAGVMRDYYWNSLKTASVPILFSPALIVKHTFSIRLNTNDFTGAIAKIASLYKSSFPGNPVEHYFLDSFFDQQYKSDRNFGRIFKMFALLAVAIACLGLFGLTAYMTGKRLKEISIRKVLGASRQTIVVLLLRDLLTLMLLAGVISLPLAWYATNSWLYSFAHKMVLTWDIFALPVFLLVFICLVTVSAHIVRGANTNPAQVLKSE